MRTTTKDITDRLVERAHEALKREIAEVIDPILSRYTTGSVYCRGGPEKTPIQYVHPYYSPKTDNLTVYSALNMIRDGLFEELKDRRAQKEIDNFLADVERLKANVEELANVTNQ